jgi:hypothetical protein
LGQIAAVGLTAEQSRNARQQLARWTRIRLLDRRPQLQTMTSPTKLRNLKEQLWRLSRCHSRKCITDGCERPVTGRAHLLPRTGVIAKICNRQNEVVRLWSSDFPEVGFTFERRTYREALTCYAYCKDCDDRIFKSIENGSSAADLESYKSRLLWTMRSVAHEANKKANNIHWYRTILTRPEFQGTREIAFAQTRLHDTKPSYEQVLATYRLLERELFTPTAWLTFDVSYLPRVDMCGSTMMIPWQLVRRSVPTPLRFGLLTFFPQDNHLTVLLGWPREFLSILHDAIPRRSEGSTMVPAVLSDLIMLYSEDWAMSPALYETIKPHEQQIREAKKALLRVYRPTEVEPPPNIFEWMY